MFCKWAEGIPSIPGKAPYGALPLSTPICYHQLLRTSRVFCYEFVTNVDFAKMASPFLRGFTLRLRLRRGQRRAQGTKTEGFHPFWRTCRQSRNENKGLRPLINPRGGSRSFLFDKLRQLRYNIFKYNTQGKRRSAHHPKGGVAYDEIIGFHYCLVKRYKVGDNHHSQKITALLTPER